MLETPVPTPFVDKIEITISKPDPLNVNPKPAVVAQFMHIAKSKKLPNPLIFDRN